MAEDFIARLSEVVERYPDAPAICENGVVVLHYARLWERVARLGSLLIESGVGPEDVVALGLAKSAEFVVAQLGCWYAGAAFLPLDPALPAVRRASYLLQAAPKLVVNFEGVSEADLKMPAVASTQKPTRIYPPSAFEPSQLAYVIFTSGSSGRPKGVLVTHQGLVSMLDAQIASFELAPHDRSLWLLSTAFDASISDIGTVLLSGACLCIEDAARTRTPSALLETVERLKIHYLDLPPALLPYLDERGLSSLRTIVIGGEVADAKAVRRFARKLRVINVYGPTEATVCTSLGLCHERHAKPLLGKELPFVRYAVRDARGSPCAVHVPGELHISGPCLARGYLGSPEHTAARFVEHQGVRAFKTGDRVVRLASGELEFLGRIDRQLKVRGALVSPEEIEGALLGCHGIMRAAVSATGAESTLTAFVESDAAIDVAQSIELKRQLAQTLPNYMVPDRIQHVANLPTTDSGKVDFGALEQLVHAHRPESQALLSYACVWERTVAGLFTQVLGATPDLQTRFDQAGGNSLKLIELIARASQQGIELSPEMLREHATIRQLAAHLARDLRRPEGESAAALRLEVERELKKLPDEAALNEKSGTVEDAVFVTGATGFLGAQIVNRLLASTCSRVICLVRAADTVQARARVEAALRHYGAYGTPVERDALERLECVPGDLEQPLLGLSETLFADLSRRVTRVFHCAARVSFAASREAHYRSNVCGTREVLRFVRCGLPKALHYASTLSVFVAADAGTGTFFEADALASTQTLFGAYAQTKWAAEHLVRHGASARAPTYIYRLGLLTGDSQTGRGAKRDWLGRTVLGLARLGSLPEPRDPELAFDATPVDYAASAMVAIARHGQETKERVQTVHLNGSRPVKFDQLVESMRALGIPVRGLTREAWKQAIQAQLDGELVPDLASALLALDRACIGDTRYRDFDLFQATRCRFDDQHARRLLRDSGVVCPEATPGLLERYVRAILSEEGSSNAD